MSPKLAGPATLAIAAMAACALVAGCGSGAAGAAGQASSTATSSIAAQASSTPRAPNAPSTGLTAEQVAHRMKLRHVTAYTAATDPNHLLGRQGGYTSKINWSKRQYRSLLYASRGAKAQDLPSGIRRYSLWRRI